MKHIKLMVSVLLMAALMLGAACQAAGLQKAWMEYEDYSGGRAEQSVEDANNLALIEAMLLRARDNVAKLDECTMNCTLFCMNTDGDIVGFYCATDGCPYIYSELTKTAYSLGEDYDAFWAIFSQVREGMGFDASSFFDLDEEG